VALDLLSILFRLLPAETVGPANDLRAVIEADARTKAAFLEHAQSLSLLVERVDTGEETPHEAISLWFRAFALTDDVPKHAKRKAVALADSIEAHAPEVDARVRKALPGIRMALRVLRPRRS
jgi:hypothetical protein